MENQLKVQAQKAIDSKKREIDRAIETRDETVKNFGYESALQEHQRVEQLKERLVGMTELFNQLFD